jgi:hypothetical protein
MNYTDKEIQDIKDKAYNEGFYKSLFYFILLSTNILIFIIAITK